MGWSKTAPSGITWGSWVESGHNSNNYYDYWIQSRIGRGATNTIAVAIKLCVRANNYAQRTQYPNVGITLRPQVSVGGTSSWNNYGDVACSSAWGTWDSFGPFYYTGTANSGVKVYAWAWYTSGSQSGKNTHTAPAYTTKYTIAYNANGGSGAPGSQTKTYAANLTLSTTRPTRTGYTFLRWNTKADGTGTNYNPGATYSANAAATLYAQWQINTYTITYKANGSGQSDVTQSKTHGTAVTLKPASTFSWAGHRFDVWNMKADGTGTSYAAGASFSGNANTVLYAMWDGTWPVVYKGNGATGGSTQSQTKVEDEPLIIQENGFTWDKHTFLGWNTKADGSGTGYAQKQTYTANAALTLYAQWQKNNIPVYVNVEGTVRQVERAYYNDNGTIRECTLYYNDDGTIRELS